MPLYKSVCCIWPLPCIAAGAELVAGLVKQSNELTLIKKRFSAFFHTHLDLVLRYVCTHNNRTSIIPLLPNHIIRHAPRPRKETAALHCSVLHSNVTNTFKMMGHMYG
jgi:hypothetical protein